MSEVNPAQRESCRLAAPAVRAATRRVAEPIAAVCCSPARQVWQLLVAVLRARPADLDADGDGTADRGPVGEADGAEAGVLVAVAAGVDGARAPEIGLVPDRRADAGLAAPRLLVLRLLAELTVEVLPAIGEAF